MDHTGDKIKFMIATKTAFPHFLMRYYYNGSVRIIGTESLSFSREEISVLLGQSPHIRERDECAAVLEEYSEGWPVGVMSVLLRANQSRNPVGSKELRQMCDECPVKDYLMYEVFRKLPFDIQRFLTDTSVLTVVSADLCNAVLGISNAKATLDYLVRENLFVIKLGGSGDIYRYHSLFKSYLAEQAAPARKIQICRKAGGWCLRRDMNEQAAEYALEGDDFELAQLALERCGAEMIFRHEESDLMRWQVYLERHRTEWNLSTVLLAAQMNLLKANLRKAEELVAQAEERLKREKPYSVFWFRMTRLKAEVCLLLLRERDAKEAADQIRKAPVHHLVGKQLREVNACREIAALLEESLAPSGESRTGGGHPDGARPENLTGGFIEDWKAWQDILSLYRKGDAGLEEALLDYLGQKHRENTYSVYIGYLYACTQAPEDQKEPEAFIRQAKTYCSRNHLPLPDLGKEPAQPQQIVSENQKEDPGRRLEVHCFGEFYAKIEGSQTVIRWRTKKAKEMFAFLFDRRGREVSKDVITEALWPEMDMDSVSTLFYTTVSYVRKGLSNEGYTDVILQKNRMYSINMSRLISTREALEGMAKAGAGAQSGRLVTELYQGPYMEGIQGDWYVLEREHYERIFLQLCRIQAGVLMEAGRYKDGITVLTGAVAADEYDEQLSAMLVRCYGMAGDIKNARRQFERTQRLIEEEMGMEVGEGLRAAYQEAAIRCKNK